MNCPNNDQWRAFLGGEMSDAGIDDLGEHLDLCAVCQETVEGFTPTMPFVLEESQAESEEVRQVMEIAIVTGDLEPAKDPQASPAGEIEGLLRPSAEEGVLGELGRYAVLEVIARGGMGIVLKARDPSMDRRVAIKLLAPELAAIPEAQERFTREAQAAAGLDHPHILPIYAVDERGPIPYLVMPYNDGGTLQDRWQALGKLPVDEVIQFGVALSKGLAAAHAKGLVHRDVKPANILLSADRKQIRLADFGLARAADHGTLTAVGAVAGTPEFMAPEQILGGDVDGRTDLFSLGTVLHGLLSGECPFAGPSVADVMRAVSSKAPKALDPNLPKELRQLVLALLEKDPDKRPQTAEAVATALSAVEESEKRVTPARPMIAAGILGCVMIGLLLWWAKPPSPAFYLESSKAPFESLAEAVEASQPGQIVMINVDRLKIEPIYLTHALSIKAASGRTPVLTSADRENGLFFRTSSPLELEGLTLEHLQAGPKAGEMVRVNGAPLTVSHGLFVRTASEGADLMGNRAIVAVEDGDIQLVNTEFRAITSRAVASRSVNSETPLRIEIENCLFLATYGLGFYELKGNQGDWEARIQHTQFHCRTAIRTGIRKAGTLQMTFSNNLVTALGLIFPRHGWGKTRAALEKGLWDGQDNVYAVRLFSTITLGGRRVSGQPRGFLEWRELPMVREMRSKVGQPNMALKGLLKTTGDVYAMERAHTVSREDLRPSAAFLAEHPNVGARYDSLGPGAQFR